MSKSRTDLHLKSNIITWFSSLIIYNNCFIWIMNLASCIWSKIHGFSLKMHDLLCTALHQPMRELVCWQLTNGRLCSNINHESWILNLESIQDLLFSIYESIDDLLCLNSESVYNLWLPKNRNLGMIYKNLDFFNMNIIINSIW